MSAAQGRKSCSSCLKRSSFRFELGHELIHVLLPLHATLIGRCIFHLTLGFLHEWCQLLAFESLHAVLDLAVEIFHQALQLNFSV